MANHACKTAVCEESHETNVAIEVKDLVTHYGERAILNKVSLSISEGEIRVIMGGSGSGKSTLMRHILGLNRATSGTIRVLGNDITGASQREMYALRKQIGVSFQGGALLSSISTIENVLLPLREHTQLDEETIKIMARMKLEMVNMGGSEALMPSELSGGMAKRAALARALITDPKLLFFDEPSAGLDPVVSAELDELILRLRDALHMTIVVVTHELESAFKIADRITVLDQGVILMTGTVDEIRNSDNSDIQNMIHRRPRKTPANTGDYLQRLTARK
ncbi:MAG: ATP-binding cassette domain-containing protein [Gammaproteobacteria bacterium]|nr:ATP-binding cassette domain-containing protein [Gammaproteobacteria bacterium]